MPAFRGGGAILLSGGGPVSAAGRLFRARVALRDRAGLCGLFPGGGTAPLGPKLLGGAGVVPLGLGISPGLGRGAPRLRLDRRLLVARFGLAFALLLCRLLASRLALGALRLFSALTLLGAARLLGARLFGPLGLCPLTLLGPLGLCALWLLGTGLLLALFLTLLGGGPRGRLFFLLALLLLFLLLALLLFLLLTLLGSAFQKLCLALRHGKLG